MEPYTASLQQQERTAEAQNFCWLKAMGRREGARKRGETQSVCQIKEVIVECIYWKEKKNEKKQWRHARTRAGKKRQTAEKSEQLRVKPAIYHSVWSQPSWAKARRLWDAPCTLTSPHPPPTLLLCIIPPSLPHHVKVGTSNMLASAA